MPAQGSRERDLSNCRRVGNRDGWRTMTDSLNAEGGEIGDIPCGWMAAVRRCQRKGGDQNRRSKKVGDEERTPVVCDQQNKVQDCTMRVRTSMGQLQESKRE